MPGSHAVLDLASLWCCVSMSVRWHLRLPGICGIPKRNGHLAPLAAWCANAPPPCGTVLVVNKTLTRIGAWLWHKINLRLRCTASARARRAVLREP